MAEKDQIHEQTYQPGSPILFLVISIKRPLDLIMAETLSPNVKPHRKLK
jgi:hypothetical protein